jgi:quinol-cytochrome oxidoreductase complex cytochrome b subunit
MAPEVPAASEPLSERERALLTRGTFVLHLRPVRVPAAAIRWTRTFGLGGTALVLWGLLAATGMLMLLVYQPVPDVAHASVRTLVTEVRGGAFVRGVHDFGAHLLVLVAVLHLLRVVLTGGFHRPRRLNWVIGVALLGLVLASAFSGYLLPWDQRAFWAVTISTGMLGYVPLVGEPLRAVLLGGPEIGAGTLLGFYAWHTTFLPVLAITAMAFHFWRVRKAKGVVVPPTPSGTAERKVMFLPDLLVRECAQALVVVALVVVLAALAAAPLGAPANPGMSPNPAKAAWYFMGFQELLVHLHPVVAVCVLPLLGLAGLVALPWLADGRGPAGRWFRSGAGAKAAAWALLAGIALTALAVVVDDRLASAAAGPPGWFARGLLPAAGALAVAWAVGALARRRFQLNRDEVVQTVFVFIVSAFVTLTVIGVFFRGAGMALVAPWEV